MKFFEVIVSVKNEVESNKGVKIKNVKEVYLVDAMSVTEAEARVVQEFSKRGYKNDFSVVGAKSSNVVDIIYPEK
jgi:hypothetical protein